MSLTPDQKAARIRELHDHYRARTGFEIMLNMQREKMWWDWCEYSAWTWTTQDITRVISYLLSQIRIDKRNEGALKFNNLIGQPDKFEEDLGLAKKAARPNPLFHKPTPARQEKPNQTLTNSQGEAVHSGADAAADFRRLLQSPTP